MEEIFPTIGEDVGDCLKKMHIRVKEDGDPVTALVDDVRIIMFKEEKFVDHHYDGPR